ncbi:CaiF/GrlA family transcriptional regulator [Salmonella enterica]|nr:CaiF/GrlA family transcriptional regulator [Salmonella enterica]
MKSKSINKDNHKTIPMSVSQHHRQPLYIVIALWCQQQNRWINRNDIAKAFYISERRASFQLYYITHRQKNKVTFRLRRRIISHHPCNEIWVKKVIIEYSDDNIRKQSAQDNKSKKRNMSAYRSRVGNGMSSGTEIWKTLIMMRSPPVEGDN